VLDHDVLAGRKFREKNMAKKKTKKAKKKSITTTAKSLAKNFGKLAVDVQRVALREMAAGLRESSLRDHEDEESEEGENYRQKAEVTGRLKFWQSLAQVGEGWLATFASADDSDKQGNFPDFSRFQAH
jgi:hypothetical protein